MTTLALLMLAGSPLTCKMRRSNAYLAAEPEPPNSFLNMVGTFRLALLSVCTRKNRSLKVRHGQAAVPCAEQCCSPSNWSRPLTSD